jgi:hypothetical protein
MLPRRVMKKERATLTIRSSIMNFALMISHLPAVQHAQYVLESSRAQKAWGKNYGFFRRLSRLFDN